MTAQRPAKDDGALDFETVEDSAELGGETFDRVVVRRIVGIPRFAVTRQVDAACHLR